MRMSSTQLRASSYTFPVVSSCGTSIRSTTAHAESLNAQIKLFRSNLRGVTDTKFFLYRLEKIFA